MTYSTDDQSAMEPHQDSLQDGMEMPAWLKWIRALVIALLCASIFAMCAVGYAAVRLIGEATRTPDASTVELNLPENLSLPEGATPLSLSHQANGEVIVIYQDADAYGARLFDENGELQSEAEFQ